MSELGRELFEGGDIAETDITRCEVRNVGEAVDNVLADNGWNKKDPVAAIVLSLSQDNERVLGGELVARGGDEEERQCEAKKIWANVEKDVTLTVTLPSMDAFDFSEGGLTSNFVDDEEVVHYFHVRDGGRSQPVLDNQLQELGIGRFSLRLVCHLASRSSKENGIWLKYHLMLFPETGNRMFEMTEKARLPGWPGFKIAEGAMAVLPAATVAWGCPVLPLMRTGRSFAEKPQSPDAAALRAAVAGVMRRAGAPHNSRTPVSLAANWDKICKGTANLEKPPPLQWPQLGEKEKTPGRDL